ncbi:MAG: ATP-dependent zinc metalloprotease FtsH [bacterium]|nr:ATP-dependent zinc metalloprotease FtsH [bacterium]
MSDNSSREPKSPRRPNPKPRGDNKFEWSKATKTILLLTTFLIMTALFYSSFEKKSEEGITIPYPEFNKLVMAGEVKKGVIIDRIFTGELTQESSARISKIPKGKFKTILPFQEVPVEVTAIWDEKGIEYEFKEKSNSWLYLVLINTLPWIILIAIWIFLIRRMQGGGSSARNAFNFGKSRAKLIIENKNKVTFRDVAGADEAKEELREIIEFLKDPKKFSRLGGRVPKGVLMLGPPGTGKTLLARAVAGEADVPFFSMSGADFVEMFVGVGASRVRDLFEQGKKHAPCIIFIDEIDAVGRHRGAGLGGGHDEREQTLNQLLVEMDGFESNDGVILMAATNRPDVLDPALLRPGRFDRQVVVDRPDVRGREGILNVHTKKVPLAEDVDLEVLAKGTPGLAGAELANLVNEAALNAARRGADKVTMADFEEAKDKVMMGKERRSLLISDKEKRLTAYHEAGHVLVSYFTPNSDPVHKVTIIPRGRALGITHYLPVDEKHNYSKSYIEGLLVHLMGGRAAEKIVFQDVTTGAGNDIVRATEFARKMVCDWGMSEVLGPLAYGNNEQEIFIGRDMGRVRNYSEETAVKIDEEVRRIVQNAADKAESIIQEHIDKLHALAKALIEREILDAEEIQMVMSGKPLPPIRKLAVTDQNSLSIEEIQKIKDKVANKEPNWVEKPAI